MSDVKYVKNSHCGYCGTEFVDQSWPRKCLNCKQESYRNPFPVSVALLSVWDGTKLGTLIQQRNITPHKGEWALTGGYIDFMEDWRDAAAREVREELGLITKPEYYNLFELKMSKDNHLIAFTSYTSTIRLEDIPFVPNEEVSAIKVIYQPIELCFPTHTDALKKYLTQLR